MIRSRQRKKPNERRQQIIETVYDLLAEVHLEALTTRRIAKELGLSQPALFRHFPSRASLMLAVLEHAQQTLGAIGQRALEVDGQAPETLLALLDGLFCHVQAHPGLPRLLFGHVSDDSHELQLALRRLISMQVNLVGALVQQGQSSGHLRSGLQPQVAATALVGMVQGTILQWEVQGRPADLPLQAPQLLELWLQGAGRRSGAPIAEREPSKVPPAVDASQSGLRALDVRPILDAGEDPLQAILTHVEQLPSPGVLELTVPFLPKPLLTLLKKRGMAVSTRTYKSLHLVQVCTEASEPSDFRDLEAPQPMVQVLAGAEGLGPGEAFLARLPRMPHPLLEQLRSRNFSFETLLSPDESALVRVVRPS